MTSVEIPWNDGDGAIKVTFDGNGNGTVSLSSSANDGVDRETTLTVSTTKGEVKKSVVITVKQNGKGEFMITNNEEYFTTNSGERIIVKRNE